MGGSGLVDARLHGGKRGLRGTNLLAVGADASLICFERLLGPVAILLAGDSLLSEGDGAMGVEFLLTLVGMCRWVARLRP